MENFCLDVLSNVYLFLSVTFERKEHHNAVWGLIPEPRTDQRPRTFYFGDMTDADACEQACRAEHMVWKMQLIVIQMIYFIGAV